MSKIKKKDKINNTLSEEEIANNHIVKSPRSYFIVFGIFGLTVFLLLVGSLFRSNVNPDYPLVFKDANNKLMFITKSGSSKSDISNIEDANIVYANSDIRYLLYSNGKKLFLLDTTLAGEGALLCDNVVSYGFSSDDKAVFYVDDNDDLHVYIRRNATDYLIDSKVDEALDVVNNYVIYGKDKELRLKNFVTLENEIISKSYTDIELSKDTKYMLYSLSDGDDTSSYYVYTFSNSDNTKVLSNVYELYSKNNNFTKFMYAAKSNEELNIYNSINDSMVDTDKKFVSYTDEQVSNGEITKEDYNLNKEEAKAVEARNEMRVFAKNYPAVGYDIYYQNKETKTLLAKGVSKVYYDDITDRRIVYTRGTWDKSINIGDYRSLDEFKEAIDSKELNGLYYQVDVNAASLIDNNVSDDIVVSYKDGDGIYFVEANNGYELYYSKTSGTKGSEAVLVDSNLYDDRLYEDFELGIVYVTNDSDNKSLKYVDNGKFKVINEHVSGDNIVVNETYDSVYYIKDYDNYKGTLMLFNGIRNSKVSDNVSSFMYINEELMYVTMNYNSKTETSDLYRLVGTKTTLIYEDVFELFNPVGKIKEQ